MNGNFTEMLENHRISRSIINAVEPDDSKLDNTKIGSLRRSSGCSGIYEEILDPIDVNM